MIDVVHGSRVRFRAVFRAAGTLYDSPPVTVTVATRGVTRTIVVGTGLVRDGVGAYHYDYVCDVLGQLVVRFAAGTGEMAERRYDVVTAQEVAESLDQSPPSLWSQPRELPFDRQDAELRLTAAGISCAGRSDAYVQGALARVSESDAVDARRDYLARLKRR